MFRKQKQQKYFRKQWMSILSHLKAFNSRHDPEAIHQFRVGIKKIKALVWLSEECLKGQDFSKSIKPLKAVFRHAGEIRNAQVALQLMKRYRVVNRDFISGEKSVLSYETSQFYLKKEMYVRNVNSVCTHMIKKLKDIDHESVIRLFEKQVKKLATSFADGGDSREFHENRKKIKNLMYVYKSLPGSIARKLHLDISYLDKVQDFIGKWHDPIVLMELLEEDRIDDEKIRMKLKGYVKKNERKVNALIGDFKKNLT